MLPRKPLALAALFCFCAASLFPAILPSAQRNDSLERRFSEIKKVCDVRENLTYKTAGGLKCTLDLLLPRTTVGKNGEQHFPNGTPVVLYLHGGGWHAGTRYNSPLADRFFSDRGIAVALVSYRFTTVPDCTIATCIADCFDAARWLTKHAEEYGLDPNCMLAYGHSAGGHLSLMMALADPDAFKDDPALADVKPHFVGAVGLAAPTTFLDIDAWGKNRWLERGANVGEALGVPPEEAEPHARKISPIEWIKRDSPPVFLVHGDADTIVGFDNARLMNEKAQSIGADLALLRVPRGDHGMNNEASPLKESLGRVACEWLYARARAAQAAEGASAKTPSRNK